MKKLLVFAAILLLSCAVVSTANASTPILSLDRLSGAVGVEKLVAPTEFAKGDQSWFGSVNLAYSVLTPTAEKPNRPRVGLSFRAIQSFDTAQKPEFYVGARYTFKTAGVR